jgi:hypothetical protein
MEQKTGNRKAKEQERKNGIMYEKNEHVNKVGKLNKRRRKSTNK